MTAVRELTNRGLEDAEVRKVERRENDFHFLATTRRFFP
jgi:hypothetical protein